jgi:hypothetical protein
VDTGAHPAPTPPPPPKRATTSPEPAPIKPAATAPDDDGDEVNLDDISWDLPAGKSFRDILDDMKE